MYKCQQNFLDLPQFETNILEFLCQQANKLSNCTTYLLRQSYFTFKVVNSDAFSAQAELKNNPHFKILYSQTAQKIIESVAESFKSFDKLRECFFKGKIAKEPKLPNYRKKNGLTGITYPNQALKFNKKTGKVRLPLGREFKFQFGLEEILLEFPTNLKFQQIKELRILPRNLGFYAEWIYSTEKQKRGLAPNRVIGIDPGLNNWLACLTNFGRSFIIDGKKVKSLNQWYNKQVAVMKEGMPKGFWDEDLAEVTEKRNRQMRDAVNKAARFVINFCLRNQVVKLVFGWNERNKDSIDIGKKNNQEFVQIPTAKVKQRLKELSVEYGIVFIETEESYTSKASFLDNDKLFKFGEKPEDNKFSGKRVERGLYKSKEGVLINADCNGAGNILRKVTVQLGLSCTDLIKAARDVLTHPKRYDLFSNMSKLYRKRNEAEALQSSAK